MMHSTRITRNNAYQVADVPYNVYVAAGAWSNWNLAYEEDESELRCRAAARSEEDAQAYTLLEELGACIDGRARFLDMLESGDLSLVEASDVRWLQEVIATSFWDSAYLGARRLSHLLRTL